MKRTRRRVARIGTVIAMLPAAGCSSSSQTAANTLAGKDVPDAADDVEAAADADDDAATTGCSYPPGPYGVMVGKVLDPDLVWQGFVPNATTASTVKITDLYDCDGSKGVNALVVDSAGQWCVACQGIAQETPAWLSARGENWTKLGVQLLNLVIQNNAYLPATLATAEQWRTQWGLTAIYVVADPDDTFPTDALPYELLVDPRSMKVVRILTNDLDTNADGSDPAVTQLAIKNAAGVDGGK